MPESPTEFVHPEYLVSTEWLADHLDDSNVRILDVTAQLDDKFHNSARDNIWASAHIPGSVFFDVASGYGELSDPDADLTWTWPSIEQIEAAMCRVGVDNDTLVVLTGRSPLVRLGTGTMWCTRAWWTLHHSGVKCAILHGGVEQWEAEGRPLTDKIVKSTPRRFTATDSRDRACANQADVKAALADGNSCLIDALPNDAYTGERQNYSRPGHITGAISVPFRSFIERDTAGFHTPSVVHAHLANAGLLERERVVTYCGGAISATVTAFALKLSGHTNVAVYDGSLTEWSADPSLPMTTGDSTG